MNVIEISVNTPSFQARRPIGIYKNIKNIPNVPCACCGKKVIIPEQIRKIFGTISKPLSSLLKNGNLDQWKNANLIWEILQKFAIEAPKKTLISILKNQQNYSDLNQAIRAEQKRTHNFCRIEYEICRIINDSNNDLRSSSVVMKKLASLKKYLSGTKLEIFEQLEIYSRKYPRKSLTEIVKTDEVFKLHEAKNKLQKQETQEQINFRFENIQKIISKIINQSQDFFDELQQSAMKIYSSTQDPIIRKAKIKELYEETLAKHQCKNLISKVNREIDQMPNSHVTKDTFFVKAYRENFNDKRILESILNPIESSFEHIIPSSKNGEDKIKNGLVMHKECNSWRGNMPYRDFFEYHPEMPKNIQKQINYIARRIINGSLAEEFRFWPMTTAKTLSSHTNGEFNINLTHHCKKGLVEVEKRIKAREDSIMQLNQERKILQKQIAELNSKLDNIKRNIKELNRENNKEKPLIQSYEAHIENQAIQMHKQQNNPSNLK